MSSLKRILRQTSRKLLSQICPLRTSHRLVLNHHPAHPGIIAPVMTSTERKQQKQNHLVKRRKCSNGKKSRKSSREAALLLAAKNNLPPVQFHHVHGKTAQLSKNHFVARRTQSFCQALVFSDRIILPNERVYIKVLEITKGWSGTIRFGFTSIDPATMRYKMPKHVCPDMTNEGHTWARALADEVVRKNSVIHFSYDGRGFIHYGINNQDCGIFCANVDTSQHLWFVIDVYGLTTAVELIDPRAHYTAFGEPDYSIENIDSSLGDENQSTTMIKSTSDMLGSDHRRANMRASLRKRWAAAIAWEANRRRRPQNQFLSHLLSPRFDLSSNSYPDYLPNIHSALFPMTQQNIYSPMPNTLNTTDRPAPTNRNDQHDYYQITNTSQNRHMSANNYSTDYVQLRSNRSDELQDASAAHLTQVNSSEGHLIIPPAFAGSPSVSPRSQPSASIGDYSRAHRIVPDDEPEICHRFEAIHINGNDIYGQHNQQSVTETTTKSTTIRANQTSNDAQPIAAIRRRLQSNSSSQATNPRRNLADENKIIHQSTSTISKAKASNASQANIVRTSKTRNSKIASKDHNNNNPPTKDCPICFERPINCVLYQCGHMCTCYECGVKQWKTQSRSCPICRTIIKDVIKTYMS